MFQHIYNRIEGLPISMGKYGQIEDDVLREIAGCGLATKISGLEDESSILKSRGYEFSEKVEAYNYYSQIHYNFARIDKNKWKHSPEFHTRYPRYLTTIITMNPWGIRCEELAKRIVRFLTFATNLIGHPVWPL